MDTLLETILILETFKCGKKNVCFRIEQYKQRDNYHNRSGYSDLSGRANVGEMCLRSSSYSMVITVTTGVGTTCHWNPLEEALKTAWGQQNKA